MKKEPTFIDLPDGSGKLYVPEPRDCCGKHPCPDCFACQQCGDDRCAACCKTTPPPAADGQAGDDPCK